MPFSDSGKRKAITFSFDDGSVQDIRLIGLLNKYGLKATFNLNSELLGKNGIFTEGGQRICHYKIHPADVKYVYEGHEVAAHTLTHPLLTALDEAEIIRQVEQDRLNLSALTGYEVVGLAYPGGGISYDDRVVDILRRHTGVAYARTTDRAASFHLQPDLYRFCPHAHQLMDHDRLMALGRAFLALPPDTPQLFCLWGHSCEMDFHPAHWERLEAFFRLISGKEDVFYGTTKEVLL